MSVKINRQSGIYSNKYHGNGFQITFDNGWTVSVQWHKAAYCTRIDDSSASNCEVAVWNSEGQWFSFLEDRLLDNGQTDVMDHVEMEDLASIINRVSIFQD